MLHNQLNQRIVIFERSKIIDQAGSVNESWEVMCHTWAKVAFHKETSYKCDSITKHYKSYWVKLRKSRLDIKRGMKVQFESEDYYIRRLLVIHKDYLKFEIMRRV